VKAKQVVRVPDLVVDTKMPITAHVRELRVSLAVCLTALLLGSSVAYAFFKPILRIFQAPLHEKLFYTTPAGGFTFVIKLCLSVGIIFAIPVLVNRIFSFAKPVIPKSMQRAFAWYSLVSVFLAIGGVIFAYTVSLPSALHFLTNFNKDQIQALITVDSYFTFVLTYLIGYALLFQTPILMLFINRVKPLEPGGMMKVQRIVVLASFVVAAVFTPTPDPWNQLLMALPIILLYQIGVIAIWSINRNKVLVYHKATDQPIMAKIPVHLTTSVKRPTPQPAPVQARILQTEAANPTTPQVARTPVRAFDIISMPKTA
jgi:sec-independent protein translocase protein TatC